jgi:hypothetical protein
MKKSFGARTLIFPTPVWVVGTYDPAGKPNVMTAAWGGICCSSPPCVAVSLRKATYTYGNIVERKAFTISVPSEGYAREVDYIGMVSGKNVDKFITSGLTPVRGSLVDAPHIGEFPLVRDRPIIGPVGDSSCRACFTNPRTARQPRPAWRGLLSNERNGPPKNPFHVRPLP